MNTAESDLRKIINLHFMTILERRTEALEKEIQAVEDEFRQAGALQSGAFVKKLIELRCTAIRHILLTTFENTKEERRENRLPWTEQAIHAVSENVNELLETLFLRQSDILKEELSRKYNPGGSPREWVLTKMGEEKHKLSTEVNRGIEILRSREKIKVITEAQANIPNVVMKHTKDQIAEFDFIQDSILKEQLARDWNEVKRVRGVEAWKSCVILCGGILEGMLLDVLIRDEAKARVTYQKLKTKDPPNVNSWDLVDLVNVAKEMGLLSKGAGHLSHGLREFRNLIHPGRQMREKVNLTAEEAEIAFRVVQLCLREFSSRFLKT